MQRRGPGSPAIRTPKRPEDLPSRVVHAARRGPANQRLGNSGYSRSRLQPPPVGSRVNGAANYPQLSLTLSLCLSSLPDSAVSRHRLASTLSRRCHRAVPRLFGGRSAVACSSTILHHRKARNNSQAGDLVFLAPLEVYRSPPPSPAPKLSVAGATKATKGTEAVAENDPRRAAASTDLRRLNCVRQIPVAATICARTTLAVARFYSLLLISSPWGFPSSLLLASTAACNSRSRSSETWWTGIGSGIRARIRSSGVRMQRKLAAVFGMIVSPLS